MPWRSAGSAPWCGTATASTSQRYWHDERAVAADLTHRARAGTPEVGRPVDDDALDAALDDLFDPAGAGADPTCSGRRSGGP